MNSSSSLRVLVCKVHFGGKNADSTPVLIGRRRRRRLESHHELTNNNFAFHQSRNKYLRFSRFSKIEVVQNVKNVALNRGFWQFRFHGVHYNHDSQNSFSVYVHHGSRTKKKGRSRRHEMNPPPPPPLLVTARDSKMYYTAHKLSEFVGAKGNSLKCVTRRFEPVRGESRGGAGGMEICEFKIESFFVYALI